MRIAANLVACTLTLASAYFLYAESSATRRLEVQVHAAESRREKIESEIAVLRAERAHLSRPGRIEPAAREIGLRLPMAGDYVELEQVLASGQRSAPEISEMTRRC